MTSAKHIGLVCLIGLTASVACTEGVPAPEAAAAPTARPAAEFATINDQFAGNWELVNVERFDANDQLLPAPDQPGFGSTGTIGYIAYDRAGYMGVVIMAANRQPYSEDGPTPDEARRSIASYTTYFGPYSVNEAEGHITHHLLASRSPNGAGSDNQRGYEFHDNQLTLRPPRGESGVQLALTWQRVPDANLTSEQQKFVGFWRIKNVERRTADGESVETRQYANGYIIYTASGHMQVHLERPDRPRYASSPPSDDEIAAAVRSYTSYFGPFSVDEAARVVTHERVGSTTPSAGRPVPFLRNYEFRDNLLILSPVPATPEGAQTRAYLSWERISED